MFMIEMSISFNRLIFSLPFFINVYLSHCMAVQNKEDICSYLLNMQWLWIKKTKCIDKSKNAFTWRSFANIILIRFNNFQLESETALFCYYLFIAWNYAHKAIIFIFIDRFWKVDRFLNLKFIWYSKMRRQSSISFITITICLDSEIVSKLTNYKSE